MQVFSADLHKVGVDLVSVVTTSDTSGSWGHLVADCNLFVGREKIRYLSAVEQVVDIFKEGLFDQLSVGKQEHLWLVLKC